MLDRWIKADADQWNDRTDWKGSVQCWIHVVPDTEVLRPIYVEVIRWHRGQAVKAIWISCVGEQTNKICRSVWYVLVVKLVVTEQQRVICIYVAEAAGGNRPTMRMVTWMFQGGQVRMTDECHSRNSVVSEVPNRWE